MKKPSSPGTIEKGESVEKVLKGSFWVIAATHITVFTIIGATTRQWRLLIIFLIGFVLVMVAWALFKFWLARK